MSVVWYVLIGIVVGLLARIVHPGRENTGRWMTVLLGALRFLSGEHGDLDRLYPFPSTPGDSVALHKRPNHLPDSQPVLLSI